ncbi:hypothetical protein ACIRS1_34850 [Kitasatospora sp. NPDC101176]|uniref:hypothetical protein n=1 Tax=Kitasatospora sp. NPDC101176 TaxID=3364099 RepID=UPI00382F4AD3
MYDDPVLSAFELDFVDAGERCRLPLGQAWDRRFESTDPVREFRWAKGGQSFAGWYFSATVGGHVGYESWLERDRLILLDRERTRPPRLRGLAAGGLAAGMSLALVPFLGGPAAAAGSCPADGDRAERNGHEWFLSKLAHHRPPTCPGRKRHHGRAAARRFDVGQDRGLGSRLAGPVVTTVPRQPPAPRRRAPRTAQLPIRRNDDHRCCQPSHRAPIQP